MQHDAENGTAFDGRWRWLGQPWFLGAVALLALNDHILKEQFPSWWTGKLSDVAGVAVLATLLAVLLGPRVGLAVTGVGFIALKVVPGIAEMATPFLGGETLRDPTDLVALGVLVAMWTAMVDRDRTPRRRRCATALPVAGAIAAVLTATATSCGSDPAVVEVLTQDDTFYALVDDWGLEVGDQPRRDAMATRRPGTRLVPLRSSVVEDDDGLGPSLDSYEAPRAGGTAGGLRRRRNLLPVGRPSADRATDRWRQLGDRSPCDPGGAEGARRSVAPAANAGILSSIALLDRAGGGHDVIASLGAGGVLQRAADGAWVGRSVPGVTAAPSPGLATAAERVVVVAMTPLWIAAMAVVFTVGRRRRWRSLTAALSLMAGGWLLAVVATAAYSQVTGTVCTRSEYAVVVGTVALLGSTGVALIIGPGTLRVQSRSSPGP